MMTLEQALAQWEEAGHYGTVEDRLARGQLWLPYYSFLAKKKLGSVYQPSPQALNIVSFLLREGVLRSTDHVLDLGAGMGTYSMELARHAAAVTAVDMNADAIAVLEDWCHQAGVTNLRTQVSAWEKYTPTDRFDISFSAMCPAICNQTELLRLERMTKRSCCLLTVTRGSYEKCRMELLKGMPLKKPGGMVTEALHYLNVLYLMGRQPNMKCWSRSFTTQTPVDELIEQYRVYFNIFGVDETVSVPYMREFFAQCAADGVVTDACRMNYALIWWDVPEGETI